jgi:folate-dependent phosphoribosylglycinamide formyltransferase PurN
VIGAPHLLSDDDRQLIDAHFAERDVVERRLLGTDVRFPDTPVLDTAQGTINADAVADWVRERQPDVIVLYGTSLLKPPLLTAYDGRIINCHLGLSPYYRGSGTNFWPLVHREPEYVGATIHLAVEKVDAGGILAQVRPCAERADRSHELGTKTIIAAFDVMSRVVAMYVAGELEPRRQTLTDGRVFKRKDVTADAIRTMRRQFETGMMAEYLEAAEARCRRCPIVEVPREVLSS